MVINSQTVKADGEGVQTSHGKVESIATVYKHWDIC